MLGRTSTFSIVGYDPRAKEWGVAVQSKFLAVGSLVPYVKAGVGAIASQAKTNSRFGPEAVALLQQGMSAQETLDHLLAKDPYKEIRQVGIVDFNGGVAAYSGKNNYPYSGHRTGKYYACQGNVLLGPVVLERMEEAFLETKGDLALRLVCALEAAQLAGGEKRGQEGAALVVKKLPSFELMGESETCVDLRVDQHLSPVLELKRLLQVHRIEYAQNHKDKFYPFAGDTRSTLVQLLCETDMLASYLQKGKTLETFLESLGGQEHIVPVFQEEYINGALVDHIVNKYYQLQESKFGK